MYTRLFKTEVAVPFRDEINLVGLAQDFFSGKNRKKKYHNTPFHLVSILLY